MVNIADFVEQVQRYEDPEKLDAALSVLPLEELFAEAVALGQEEDGAGTWSEEDRLVQATLRWFKKWFRWVNAAECQNCGYEQTEGPTPGQPSEEDQRFGASTIEIWHCPKCYSNTRFPRYGDPVKLLETRAGRCGEWANVMHLILRALGRDVRYIWNSEDHVWNEIWSAKANRWIHIDSCEAAFDNPLIYTDGWGKKMAYVLGFSIGGAVDLTKKYVRRPEMALPRGIVDETELKETLSALSASLRNNFDPVELVDWYERDEAEARELESFGNVSNAQTGLLPRQSGSADWKAARGEDGSKST